MTIDRFTPRLFAGIAGLSLLGGLLALVVVLWAGYPMSIHGHVAIFLGASFTAALSLLLGVAMHISQVRQEAAEEASRRRSASRAPDRSPPP
jgi:hypothetical protein